MTKTKTLLRTALEVLQDQPIAILAPKKNMIQIEFETEEQATKFYHQIILAAFPSHYSHILKSCTKKIKFPWVAYIKILGQKIKFPCLA